jgi:hypothetical protein
VRPLSKTVSTMFHKPMNFVVPWRPAGLDLRAPSHVTVYSSCTSCPAGCDLRASNYFHFRLRIMHAFALVSYCLPAAPVHGCTALHCELNFN